jgi:hypothetical protein
MRGTTWNPTLPAVLLAASMLIGAMAATGGLGPGEWRATGGGDGLAVRLELRHAAESGGLRLSFEADPVELEGLDRAALDRRGAPLRFAWKRDAGTFAFTGEGGRRPRGTFRFEAEPAFAARWQALGFVPLAADDPIRMAALGVRLADVERLGEMGVLGADADLLIRIVVHSIPVDWVAEIRQLEHPPDLDDMVRLHAHGVTPALVRALRAAGHRDLTVDDLIHAQSHGLEALGPPSGDSRPVRTDSL